MLFKRIEPEKELSSIIECFWIIENEDKTPGKQKVIPDGFVEIIFHFGDPYRIQLAEEWITQGRSLLAGQISKYFFLENSGAANILGVKLKPTALTHLYAVPLHLFTDKVVNLSDVQQLQMHILEKKIHSSDSHEERIKIISKYFKELPSFTNYKISAIDIAVGETFKRNGMATIAELTNAAGVGERQLENLFKKYIGLSPKLFTRIIRFNYIFQLAEQKSDNWTSLAHEAAYYDQSHFIRNFKKFSGESPSAYSFDEKNMANFFLKKK